MLVEADVATSSAQAEAAAAQMRAAPSAAAGCTGVAVEPSATGKSPMGAQSSSAEETTAAAATALASGMTPAALRSTLLRALCVLRWMQVYAYSCPIESLPTRPRLALSKLTVCTDELYQACGFGGEAGCRWLGSASHTPALTLTLTLTQTQVRPTGGGWARAVLSLDGSGLWPACTI